MTYTCNKCKKCFDNKSHFTIHINKKYPCDIPTIYTCIRCNKTYYSKTDYTRHINRKNPCNKLENDNILNNNDLIKVNNDESFEVNKNELIEVDDNKLIKVNEYRCNECDKSYTTKR